MWKTGLAGLLLGASVGGAWSQNIYTCTTKAGRRITSDRMIAECMDREQRVLTPTGTVLRTISPPLSAEQLAAKEAKDREAAQEKARVAEDRRRDRALLVRYPNPALHDKERAAALQQVDEMIGTTRKHMDQLAVQRKAIDTELAFYKQDPGKVPPALKRRQKDNLDSLKMQQDFIAEKEGEKKRINERFDQEQAKLQPLWAGTVAARAPASAAERTR